MGAQTSSQYWPRALTPELLSSTLVCEVLEQILTPGAAPTASSSLCPKLSRARLTQVPEGSRKPRNARRGSNLLQHRAGKQQGWDPNPKNIPAQVPTIKTDSAPTQK